MGRAGLIAAGTAMQQHGYANNPPKGDNDSPCMERKTLESHECFCDLIQFKMSSAPAQQFVLEVTVWNGMTTASQIGEEILHQTTYPEVTISNVVWQRTMTLK